MHNFTYDDDTHTYALNGQVIDSCTQILGRCGVIDTKWFTEDGRQRGKAVHRACELDNKGELDESTVNEFIMPYLEGWRKAKLELGVCVSGCEIPMYSEAFMYGVTPDTWGVSAASGQKWPVILEIKTGVVSDWVGLQTAAQAIALLERGHIKDYPIRYGVGVSDNGSYRLKLFGDKGDYDNWNFLAMNYKGYEAVKALAEAYKS